MNTNAMLRTLTVCLSTLLLFSCDKDVSDVGGDILTGTDISIKEFNSNNTESENTSIKSIQSNNLVDGYFLGTKNSDASGSINYGVLLRAEFAALATLSDSTTNTYKVKSANLIIPYALNRASSTTTGGEEVLSIRNIQNEGEPIDVNVFRNEYQLQLTSASTNSPEVYFSNASDNTQNFRDLISKSENSIFKSTINNTPSSDSFSIPFSNASGESINDETISQSIENTNNVLRIALTEGFFGSELTDTEGNIIDINNFTDSSKFTDKFRGVFVQPNSSNTNLVKVIDNTVTQLLPQIEVVFEATSTTEAVGETEETTATTTIPVTYNLNRQVINITETITSPDFNTAFNSSETMILKGGASVSEIQLFSNEDQLDSLYNENIVVNQATLRLTVNQESTLFSRENLPESLFINQLVSGNPLVDFPLAIGDIPNHLKPLNQDDLTYDILVTQHVANILNQASLANAKEINQKLIIGLSDDNTNTTSLMIKSNNKRINIGNLQSSREVPLFGSNAIEDKRPQLIIKFTTTK